MSDQPEGAPADSSPPAAEVQPAEHPFDIFAPAGAEVVEALKKSGYSSVEELAAASNKELQRIKGIGVRDVPAIRGLIAHFTGVQPEGASADSSPPAAEVQPKPKGLSNASLRGPRDDSNIKVGPVSNLPNDGKLRATKNLVLKWKDGKQEIERSVAIGQVINDLPKEVQEEMIQRGEARR